MTDLLSDAKKFFTPAATIKVEDPDRDKYCKPYARDETPAPEGSCPYVGNKPFYATTLRVCKNGCSCQPSSFEANYRDCPIYLQNKRLDEVLI